MIRKIGLSLLCAAGLYTTHAFSLTAQTFQLGTGVIYTLPVNEPQIISNQFLWTIKAVCTMSSENDSNPFSFKVLRKSGSFNGFALVAGDFMDIIVHANEKVYITAISGGKVELINHGEKTMYADCSVA